MKKFAVAFLFLIASACFCQTDTIPFTIDLSHSKFKFDSTFLGRMFFYTVNGKKFNNSIAERFFLIAALRDIENNFEARKAYTKQGIEKFKEKNLNGFEEKEMKINHMRAYEASYVYTDSIKHVPVKLKAYSVIFGDDKTTIGFYGIATDHFNKTIKQFKRIAKSIKIK